MVIILILAALLIFSLIQSMKGNYKRRESKKVEPIPVGSTYPNLQYRNEKLYVTGRKEQEDGSK